MYSGEVSVTEEQLVPLVQAAKTLGIKGLVDVPVQDRVKSAETKQAAPPPSPPPPVRIPPIQTEDISVAALAVQRRAEFRRQVEDRLKRQGLTVSRKRSHSAFKHRKVSRGINFNIARARTRTKDASNDYCT